jgi:hypothetical protein
MNRQIAVELKLSHFSSDFHILGLDGCVLIWDTTISISEGVFVWTNFSRRRFANFKVDLNRLFGKNVAIKVEKTLAL